MGTKEFDDNEFQAEEQACSEAHLRRITGQEDLKTVRSLALTVDTNDTQVDHLGSLMPLLAELRLERGSTLASFRDFGSSLANLRVMWLPACGVRHLDGVGALAVLEELYLAFNDVEDLTSIALHDRLEVLDLESNNVRDAEQALHLGTCTRLWSLILTANPVRRDKYYRRTIVEAVPQLACLDEENVTDDDRRPPSASPVEEHEGYPPGAPQMTHKRASTPSHHQLSSPSWTARPRLARAERRRLFRRAIGTGNINLREPEVFENCRSEKSGSRREDSLSSHGAEDAPELGQQAEAASQITEDLAVRSPERRPNAFGDLSGDGRGNQLGVTQGLPPDRVDFFPKRSQTHARTRSPDLGAGGREGEAGYTPHPESALGRNWQREALPRAEGCRRRSPSDNATKAADAFADEDELVVKAIKNFRLLAKSGTSPHNSALNSRRQAGAEEMALGSSGSGRTATRVRGAGWALEASYAGGASNILDLEKRPPMLEENIHTGGCVVAHAGKCVFDDEADYKKAGDSCVDETSNSRNVWQEYNWLFQALSLGDMTTAMVSEGARVIEEKGHKNASSALTHGSEVSIAGNPAFGLRRRRTQDQASCSNGSSSSSRCLTTLPSSSPEPPLEARARQKVKFASRAGADTTAETAIGCPRPLSAECRTRTRPECVYARNEASSAVATGSLRDYDTVTTAGGAAVAAAGGGEAQGTDFAREGLNSGHGRLGHPTTPPSLSCRALLSPPSWHQEDPRRTCRRPLAAGAESPYQTFGTKTMAGIVANIHPHGCGDRGSTESNEPLRFSALHSKSAAELKRTEHTENVSASGYGPGRKRSPTSGSCGSIETNGALPARTEDTAGGDFAGLGCRRRLQAEREGLGGLDEGHPGCEWRESRSPGGNRTAFEAPEWSPKADSFSVDGSDAYLRGSGRGSGRGEGKSGFGLTSSHGDDLVPPTALEDSTELWREVCECIGFGSVGPRGEKVVKPEASACGSFKREDRQHPRIEKLGSDKRMTEADGQGSRRSNRISENLAGVVRPSKTVEPAAQRLVSHDKERHDKKLWGGSARAAGLAGHGGKGRVDEEEESGPPAVVGERTLASYKKLVAMPRRGERTIPQSTRKYLLRVNTKQQGRLLRAICADRGSVCECDAKIKRRHILLERLLGKYEYSRLS